ncbi:MAG: hypothetical protein CSA11_10460 [Chloroflexi bacterium]|nr:MAG: hypothetical protein CSB13_07350 [Chloroflexota bacterium]PIE79880.1 MAG: hypothetical protein CSA11_10460 [Chloroflexota bacterium]
MKINWEPFLWFLTIKLKNGNGLTWINVNGAVPFIAGRRAFVGKPFFAYLFRIVTLLSWMNQLDYARILMYDWRGLE